MSDVLNQRWERGQSSLLRDTRRFSDRAADFFASEEAAAMLMVGFGIGCFYFRHLVEFVFLAGVLAFFYLRKVQKKAGLAMRMPKSSGQIDPKEIDPKDLKPSKAEGIFYVGNCADTGEEVWLTDGQARTHMLFMGTTGSGKTEYLISLVYNALIHGSGLIYVDGKADSSLYGKVYSMARSMGREDDVLVINFQTGAKDIYGAQPSKLSNTLNPFAVGSSGMLSELVKGLMATGEKSTWTQQAESFVEALLKPLVYLRDNFSLDLDVNVIRDYFKLDKIEDLVWRDPDRYPGLLQSGALDGLRAYLENKPGYKKEKFHDQSDTTHEQHGYITMQLGRTFNSLSDTYGYIMKTPLAEIDFVDVFLNRRILVVLLPALEKSPSELTNLGRIVVAAIKATMAKGLGSLIEGEWSKIIDSKPTTSPSPFPCVLDEYGYYAVEGFAVVPAQARSLGFSSIFAGQDLPAFEKASKEEAKSTLANTNTKFCGKLECVDTFKYFENLAGQGLYTRLARYEADDSSMLGGAFKADDNINIERVNRVSLEALRGQISGQWHMFYGNAIVRVKSFFANPKKVKWLRVNHFIRVARPALEEIESFKASTEMFNRAVLSDGGLKSFMDVVGSPSDIKDIIDGFELFAEQPPLLRASLSLAHCARAESRRAEAFAKLTAASFEVDDSEDFAGGAAAQQAEAEEGDAQFDFASHIAGGGAEALQPAVESAEQAPWGDETMESIQQEFGAGVGAQSAAAVEPTPEVLSDEYEFTAAGTAPTEPLQGDEIDADAYEAEAMALLASGETDGYAMDDFREHGSDARLNLLGADALDHDHMSIYGGDAEATPDAIMNTRNDVDDGAFQMADEVDVEQFAGEMEFDAPMADEGILSREVTISGLAALELATGASQEEAQVTAAIVAEDLGNSTRYPITPPSKAPVLDDLELLAKSLAAKLQKANGEGSK